MEAESAASESRRDVRRRDVRRREGPNRVRRFPTVVVPSTIYKPGEFAFVRDPKKAEEIKAAYRKKHLTVESMMPFPHKLAKLQIELERKGESYRLRLTPDLQKQVDEARQAMNHPRATGKPIETLVQNLNLEASSSTGTRADAKAGSGVSRETMLENLNPAANSSSATGTKAKGKVGSVLKNYLAESMVENLKPAGYSSAATGTKAQVKATSILKCPREVLGKVTMVENLNYPATAAIGEN